MRTGILEVSLPRLLPVACEVREASGGLRLHSQSDMSALLRICATLQADAIIYFQYVLCYSVVVICGRAE